MALVGAVRGVSGRQGIFLTGKPQQLLACDDGLVLVVAPGLGAPLGGPLAGGLLAASVRNATSAAALTAVDLGASLKRATTLLWPAVESAELRSGNPGRKLRVVAAGVTASHAYGRLEDPDRWLVPLLAERLGARFTDSRRRPAAVSEACEHVPGRGDTVRMTGVALVRRAAVQDWHAVRSTRLKALPHEAAWASRTVTR